MIRLHLARNQVVDDERGGIRVVILEVVQERKGSKRTGEMRNFYVLLAGTLLALAALPARSEANWDWVNPTPQGNDLRGVCFADSNSGFAVGDAGSILQTMNGGANWNVSYVGRLRLNAFQLVGTMAGYACGDSGSVLKTTDDGASWTVLSVAGAGMLNCLRFPVDAQTGFVCGDSGVVARTTDGGNTWAVQSLGSDLRIFGAWFVSNESGYVVGDMGRVRKTTDGGATWQPESVSSPKDLYGVCFPAGADTGFVCADMSTVFRTVDGGASWDSIIVPGPNRVPLRGVCFPAGNQTGIVCGDLYSIFRTTDGGVSWQPIFSQPDGLSLNAVSVSSGGATGFAVGSGGMLLRGDIQGMTWAVLTRGFSGPLLDITFPQDTLTGYAATPTNVYKTVDGGVIWTGLSAASPITAFSFPQNALVGYGASLAGSIFKTSDGGLSWHAESCPGVGDDYIAVTFPSNESVGYACSMAGAVVKTTDAGSDWTLVASPDTLDIPYTVCFESNRTGFMGTSGSSVCRTTDGGATWATEFPGGQGFRSFCFPGGGDTGFACGYNGSLLKSSNGGATWTSLGSGTTVNLSRVCFPADCQTGYVAGDQGTVLSTTDGGLTWAPQFPPVALVNFVAMAFPNGSLTGYLGGDAGAVLVTRNGGINAVARTGPARPTGQAFLSVYPNPARHYAYVRVGAANGEGLAADGCRLQIFDRCGRAIESLNGERLSTDGYRLDVSRIPAGVYFVRADGRDGSGRLDTRVTRLVVAK
jgi:photosystem II stability/assembly factor-like uncharacterized protein